MYQDGVHACVTFAVSQKTRNPVVHWCVQPSATRPAERRPRPAPAGPALERKIAEPRTAVLFANSLVRALHSIALSSYNTYLLCATWLT
ncbi:hypothetical protein EVAR_23813_1 [Eumeta japonica]|uniref:Uncharacterized protein n=1 Tax=Eumeta variegata TaxID=151549 RepID=A0A4C1VM08_EUMVA|nr:hypothetical protein EVAR_23813_1 [Eumeta japonica]